MSKVDQYIRLMGEAKAICKACDITGLRFEISAEGDVIIIPSYPKWGRIPRGEVSQVMRWLTEHYEEDLEEEPNGSNE